MKKEKERCKRKKIERIEGQGKIKRGDVEGRCRKGGEKVRMFHVKHFWSKVGGIEWDGMK